MARLTYKTEDGSWGLRGGPWTQLAALGITDDLLRDILTGNASPTIKEWREIGRALDELEGKGAASE